MRIYIFIACLVVTNGHIVNRVSIKRLQNQVKDLQSEQDEIFVMLDALETNLTAQISQVKAKSYGGEPGVSTGKQVIEIGSNFEDRLTEMEGKIEALKNYLMGEKKGDILLRKRSEEVIEEMNGKVKETEAVIGALKIDVMNALTDFEDKIFEVNQTANVKINANGAILYGGVGSACTFRGGECQNADSECRDGRCQCLLGLSYDVQARSCVDSCKIYGETYQSVSKKIIRGFNDETVEDISLAECKRRCVEEATFLCRSFDYFPQWRTCYMSASVNTDVPDDAWEYNSEGYHFQRDCQ